MAASGAAAAPSPGLCPSFAVICSFLERYGALLDLPELTFPQLERYLQDTSSVPKLLVDLHVKLLRKIGKSVSADRWEKYLVKICQEFNTTWAWELEKKGYLEMTVECKTGILKYLCECQFDDNVKFKTAINEEDPDKMRLQPIGRDKDGLMYWFQLDQDHNVRVYVEEQDDLDGSSWKCIVKNRDDLAQILGLLKTQIDPALLTKKDQEEGSSSNSPSPEDEENKKKEDGDVKKENDLEDEKSKDASPVSPKSEKEGKCSQNNDNLKQETTEQNETLKNNKDIKKEAKSHPGNDGTIIQTVKEEPMEEDKASKSSPVVPPEMSCGPVPSEQTEELVKKSSDEVQRAIKNDQQAKIPLKKREMKRSEGFDTNCGSGGGSSSIIVRNPAVAAVKEVHAASEENGINGEKVNGEVSSAVELESEKQKSSEKKEKTETGPKDRQADTYLKGVQDLSVTRKTEEPDKSKEEQQKRKKTVKMDDIKTSLEESMEVDKPQESSPQNEPAVTKEDRETSPKQEATPQSTEKSSEHKETGLPKDKAKEKDTEKAQEIRPEEKKAEEVTSVDAAAKSPEPPVKVTPVETTVQSNPEKSDPVKLKETPKEKEDTPDTKDQEKKDPSDHTNETIPPTLDKKADVSEEVVKSPFPGETETSTSLENKSQISTNEEASTHKESEKSSTGNENKKQPELQEKSEHPACDEGKKDCTVDQISKDGTPVVDDKKSEQTEKETLPKEKELPVVKKSGKSDCLTEEKRKSPEVSNISKESKNLLGSKDEKYTSESSNKTTVCDETNNESTPTEPLKSDSDGKSSTDQGSKEKATEKESVIQEVQKRAGSPHLPKDSKIDSHIEGNKRNMDKKMEIDVGSKETGSTNTEKQSAVQDVEEKTECPSPKESKVKPHKKGIRNDEMEITSEDTKTNEVLPVSKEGASQKTEDSGRLETTKDPSNDASSIDHGDGSLTEACEKQDQQDKSTDESKPSTESKVSKVSKDESKLGSSKEDKKEESKQKGDSEETSITDKVPEDEKPEQNQEKDKNEEVEANKEGAENGNVPRPRMKIRVGHRRKVEVLREEGRGDSESEVNEGRCLRRSPRICRPTVKIVEVQERKAEKKQVAPLTPKDKDKDENEEQEEEDNIVQKKPRERKVDPEKQMKPKQGRRRRRTRWSSTRTRRKKKGSEDDDEDDESSSEEEETEEDDSDEDYKVERTRKRRRNCNRVRNSSDSSTSCSEEELPNDDPCKHCGLPNHPELILLCDSCDNGYHTACLRPPLMIIPDGEWFCPPCQHKLLCDKLEEQLQNIDAALKKKERAERRKERLVYVGISVENIITPTVEEEVEEEKEEEKIVKEKKEVKKSKGWGRRSTRAKKYISYRFDEFDEAIEEAIEEDIKEAEGGGAGRGKDMANITGHRGKDISTILNEEGKENGRPQRPNAGQRRKKRRRLNDLDSDSTVEEEESEEEFRLSDSSEEEEFVASDKDVDSEAEDQPDDSDFDSDGRGPVTRVSRRAPRRRLNTRPRRRRRPRGYSDDEELEETDEEEDEIETERSSDFSDSDLDMRRRRSHRSRKKQVNYRETSDSDGSQASTNKDKPKSRRRLSSSDSDASFNSADSDEEDKKSKKRKADSSEEESRKRHRRLSLKRRRESEDDDDDDDDDSDDSDESEEDRPVRKRVNRIDSDDTEEEEEDKKKTTAATMEKVPEKEQEKEPEEVLGKEVSSLDYNLVELPPTNGQSPIKGLEGLIPRPAVGAGTPNLGHTGLKNSSAPPPAAMAANGLVPQEMAPQDEDEDDLLGVTDLVDYVCNSEQLKN